MPQLPKGKVYVGFYISEKLAAEFRELAKKKHQGMYGLSVEGEAALKKWLEQNLAHAQGARPIVNVDRSPVSRAYSKVLDYLAASRGIDFDSLWLAFDGASMPRSFLVEAIEQTIGNDRRTVKKWEEAFRRAKLVKDAGGFGVFKVMLRRPGYVETEDGLTAKEQRIIEKHG